MNIGSLAKTCIKQGLTNHQTVAVIKHVFPDSKTNARCISWYRVTLKKGAA